MGSPPSSALVKRNSDTTLMPPPPPPKRQKRPAKVLDEDVYSEAISHIIARDFFPGLLETQAQQEYIEALESKNSEWIRESGRKLTQVMTPGPGERRRGGRGTSLTSRRSAMLSETPRHAVASTPLRTPSGLAHEERILEEQPEVDLNLSLGAYQAKYTSEDNESFNALLDKQNEKHAGRYAFFQHGNKIPSARQIAFREQKQNLLQNDNSSSALIVTNAAGEERRAMSSLRPSQDLDARPASVDNFPNHQGPRNSFMFAPDSVEDRFPTYQQQAEDISNAAPKAINYSATRFSTKAAADSPIPPSLSMSAVDAAIAGRPRATASEAGYSGSETPRVNGYAFVDEDPTPSELGMPVTDEEAEAAEREAVKQYLPKLDGDGPNPFNIAGTSRREDLHHMLVEKADAGRRKGGRLEQLQTLGITSGRTPTPRFLSSPDVRKGTLMTPAARRLAKNLGTPKRGNSIFGSDRKASSSTAAWTPTPRIKRLSSHAKDDSDL